MSKILVSGGLVPTTKDTLIDARTRVATFSDIANIENPARFMVITVEDTGKKYEVKKLTSKIIGGIVVENSTIDINDPEALVDLGLAEELRSEEEKVRQSNEKKRIEAENLRKSAEDSRNVNETNRVSAEGVREASERTRVRSEETRNANEQTRNSNETKRQLQESTRQSQESARQNNERTRNTNESARKEAESERKTEETSRRTAELSRSSAENERVKNEQNRTTAENTRSSAEDRRVVNETQRTTNETARSNAELSREQAEGNRSSTFNTLKGQMQTTIKEGQTAVAATEKATSDAQKVVDNYDAKVAEQDSKLTELGSKLENTNYGLINLEEKDDYITEELRQLNSDMNKVSILSNPLQGVDLTVEPLAGINFGYKNNRLKGAIKKIWLGGEKPDALNMMLEKCPIVYLNTVNNNTGSSSPAIYFSTQLDSNDLVFRWTAPSGEMDNHRTGVEVMEFFMNITIFNELGLPGYNTSALLLYMEFDWDAWGEPYFANNLNLEIDLRKVSKKDVTDTIRFANSIKKIWLGGERADSIQMMLEKCPIVYANIVNNNASSVSPAFYCSRVKGSNDMVFRWNAPSSERDKPREGVELLELFMHIDVFNELGLLGYNTSAVLLYIEFDWDTWGEPFFAKNLDIEIDLKKVSRSKLNHVEFSGIPISSNLIVGKKILCLGDSITEFRDRDNSLRYSDYLSIYEGVNTYNLGVGGSTIRQRAVPTDTPTTDSEAYSALDVVNVVRSLCEKDFSKQIAANEYLKSKDDNSQMIEVLKSVNLNDIDIVTIFAGTNDWATGNLFGEHGSTDINTTLGAINDIIKMLMLHYPHIKIYWFTPIVRWMYYSNGFGEDSNWSDVFKKGGYTLGEFSKLITEEVVSNHIPCCDMYYSLGWNKYNFGYYFLKSDGTHPQTYNGFSCIAKKIASFIKSNML